MSNGAVYKCPKGHVFAPQDLGFRLVPGQLYDWCGLCRLYYRLSKPATSPRRAKPGGKALAEFEGEGVKA